MKTKNFDDKLEEKIINYITGVDKSSSQSVIREALPYCFSICRLIPKSIINDEITKYGNVNTILNDSDVLNDIATKLNVPIKKLYVRLWLLKNNNNEQNNQSLKKLDRVLDELYKDGIPIDMINSYVQSYYNEANQKNKTKTK